MLGGAESPGAVELLTVTVVRDEHGYGMKVSGDNPVYVQSVKEHGAAWRAGLRAGDRILRVDNQVVAHHSHQQVVQMIRANPTTVLTVQQHASRLKTPITAPVPANLEKQRQFEASKVKTVRLMLEKEQKYIRDLRNELLKVPDVRKSAELESAEQRCSTLQREIDVMTGTGQLTCQPSTPRNARTKSEKPSSYSPSPNTGFLSGLPRSLSNLTGQSLRNLRQARQKNQQENQPPLVRQNSDESNNKRRHVHNNTVPMVPTTCLDNSPPPLPPRSTERPKRNPLSPTSPTSPVSPLANPLAKKYYKPLPETPRMAQSMPAYSDNHYRRSSRSLDGELDGPQPNSIALQMSYPLVNVPPPPLQMDNRNSVPVLHVRSRSSPEQLDHDLSKSFMGMSPTPCTPCPSGSSASMATPRGAEWGARDTPPPGTPPPPYHTNTQPCADPQRAIISMEEDDSPASDNSTYSGLFCNLRSVRESKARTAVLLNWLLGERRCACACLLLVLTDSYRGGAVPLTTLRRWAYEIHSAFLMPHAVLQLSGVDENMANEIEHVLVNEFEKEELLRNVFRKARQKAKDELAAQLSEFQVKRQVGLASLYGPDDSVIDKCDVDKIQEQAVVERLMVARLRQLTSGGPAGVGACARAHAGSAHDAQNTLMAALAAAALCLQCRPAAVASAMGSQRAAFLQRDKLYKQRVKQITKQHQPPFVVRGHHLQLQALTSVAHCHHCDHAIAGLAPQAYFCTDCKLRVHRACAKQVEEPCCIDGDHHNNRISRFMERIHHNNQINSQELSDKKSRKASGTANFLNMERSFRKTEDEQPWESATPASIGETRREGSNDEPTAPDADVDTSDAAAKDSDKDNTWRAPASAARGVNRAESCRERDAPRRGKHRNASDPNRLTAHHNNDLEPGSVTAPSGSSSSSSLSSRSNESNTVTADQQASQSDFSDEDEPLAAQWADSISPHVLSSISLSARLRKRQEVIHELIVSEGSHVRWLKVLGRVFLRPLESQPTLLSPEDLKALFPNLPSVREKHVTLYSELRKLRKNLDAPLVDICDVADAMLKALGDVTYASTLAHFCSGQRMALEALRERRRKNKELHQFLAAREQLPLCGRLQLRDLLACVWQRLTKYQLLLESVLKTVEAEDAGAAERVQKALGVAKDVLHSVDTAVRTAENEHRLRSIQCKLEVRAPASGGAEWEELRRLDLTAHALRTEGELAIRNDSNKKIHVLALMLEDSLVLIQREGDKFLLKPIAQPSQQQNLSPLIKWDKVLFRPNAAVRNTFFLMNINGVQMHELSTNSAPEYATWVKHIQEAPLAKLTELKPIITPSHQASRSTDDSGINVSRNPSDASEKSNSTVEDESERERLSAERVESERDRASAESERDRASAESERDRASAERADSERDKERSSVEREERRSLEKEEGRDVEEKHKVRRSTVGRISTHDAEPPPPLEPRAVLTVTERAAHTAHTALSNQERLRRLDGGISRCLRAKSLVVADMLGVPHRHFTQVADLAVAEALGQVDVSGELRARGDLAEEGEGEGDDAPDVQQLLLAACTQANQLTLLVRGALSVNESTAVSARARAGRCDSCRRTRDTHAHVPAQSPAPPAPPEETDIDSDMKPAELHAASLDEEYDTLSELDVSRGRDEDDATENSLGAAQLATRLVEVTCGLQGTLARLLASTASAAGVASRGELAALRETNDALRARLRTYEHHTSEEITFLKADPTIQDQPSNGG